MMAEQDPGDLLIDEEEDDLDDMELLIWSKRLRMSYWL